MFAGYVSEDGEVIDDRRIERPSSSTNRGREIKIESSDDEREPKRKHDDTGYTSYNRERIMEERRKKERLEKEKNRLSAAMDFLVSHSLGHESSDSDGDMAPGITLPSSISFKESNSQRNQKSNSYRRKSSPIRKRKRSSSSSSSSSGSDRRRKKHRKSKKNRKKRSSSSSSSDRSRERRRKKRSRSRSPSSRRRSDKSSVVEKKYGEIRERWDFLKNLNINCKTDSSFLVYDTHRDAENFIYDHATKSQSAVTNSTMFPMVIGTKADMKKYSKVFDLLLPKEIIRKETRLLDDISATKGSTMPEIFDEKPGDLKSFIKLSASKFRPYKPIEEETADKAMRQQIRDREEEELHQPEKSMEKKRASLNQDIYRDPKNTSLYFNLINFEEEIFERNRILGVQDNNRTGLRDRQLSILDKAIDKIPNDYRLYLKKLEILRSTLEVEQLLVEWRKILHKFVNKCEVWEQYLDLIQYNSPIYTHTRFQNALDLCKTKLSDIVEGTIKSHRAEGETTRFLLKLFIRRIRWLMESGYVQKAVASIQASIEFNMFAPDNTKGNKKYKESRFSSFWDSGVARIGDIGAKGWKEYKESSERCPEETDFDEYEKENSEADKAEAKLRQSKQTLVHDYVYISQKYENIYCRPLRSDQDQGISRITRVSFDDISIYIDYDGIDYLSSFLGLLGAQSAFGNTAIVNTSIAVSKWQNLSFDVAFVPPIGVLSIAERILLQLADMKNTFNYALDAIFTRAYALEQSKEDFKSKNQSMQNLLDTVTQIFMRREEYEQQVAVIPICKSLQVMIKWALEEERERKKENISTKSSTYKTVRKMINKCIEHVRNSILATSIDIYTCKRIHRQVLLSMIIFLVELDSDPPNAWTELTAFILRKDVKDVQQLDKLQAITQFHKLHDIIINDSDQPCDILVDDLCLVRSGLIYLEYSRVSSSGSFDECRKIYSSMKQKVELNENTKHIVRTYATVLLHRWNTQYKSEDRQELTTDVLPFIVTFPSNQHDSINFVQIYFDMNRSYMRRVNIQRDLESANTSKMTEEAKMQNVLAKLYLQTATVLQTGSDCSTAAIDVFRKEAEKLRDPYIWRMTIALIMRLAGGKGVMEWNIALQKAREIHVMAMSQCVWSRNLHLDLIQFSNQTEECSRICMMMEEKDVFTHITLDEVELLRKSKCGV